jgi:hypothetical protein
MQFIYTAEVSDLLRNYVTLQARVTCTLKSIPVYVSLSKNTNSRTKYILRGEEEPIGMNISNTQITLMNIRSNKCNEASYGMETKCFPKRKEDPGKRE